MSHVRERYPEANAAAHPVMTTSNPIELATSPRSFASRINAPRMAGIETMKENSPALLLGTPQNNAPEIVEPLLEIPGKVPMP